MSLSEGNSGTTDARFAVSLAQATSDVVTVTYATSNGSATAPSDYDGRTGTITFNPGERLGFVDVPVKGDGAVEGDETFTVALSNPVQGTIGGDGSGAGTILNDDLAPPSTNPAISIDDVSMPEGDSGTSQARFLIGLDKATGDQVTVNYQTQDGSAGAPGDYDARSGTLTFEPGERFQPIDVPVKGDTADESNETFTVALSVPARGCRNAR